MFQFESKSRNLLLIWKKKVVTTALQFELMTDVTDVSYLHGHKQYIRIAFRQILWGNSTDFISISRLNLPFQFVLKI